MKTLPPLIVSAVRRNVIFLLCLLACVGVRADDVFPRPADAKRYDKLAAHSPFAPPSAAPVAAPPPVAPPPGPSWSDNLTVTTLVQDGKVYSATVLEKDTSLTYLVRSDQVVNPDHALTIASVKWAARPEDITVTLAKGKEFGEVRFDPSVTAGGSSAVGAPSATVGRTIQANPGTPFHPPPPPIPGGAFNVPGGQPPNNVLRQRQLIRAAPPVRAPVRPVLGRPIAPVRPGPGKPAPDPDDDDDN